MHVLATGWLKASPTASLMASSPYAKCPTWPFSPNWLTGTGASALSYSPDPPAATRAWQTLQVALTAGPTHHHRYQLDALLPAGSPLRMGGEPLDLRLSFPQSCFSLGLKASLRPGLGLAPQAAGLRPHRPSQGPPNLPQGPVSPAQVLTPSYKLSPLPSQCDTPLPAGGAAPLPVHHGPDHIVLAESCRNAQRTQPGIGDSSFIPQLNFVLITAASCTNRCFLQFCLRVTRATLFQTPTDNRHHPSLVSTH